MILASILVFALSRMSGDPRLLFLTPYFHNSEEQWERWGVMLGLDKPYYMQYLIWLGKCLTGDWGQSIDTKLPVIDLSLIHISEPTRPY